MSTPALLRQSGLRTSPFRVIATGLNYPEGPVCQPDGTVLVVEIGAGKLTRVHPDGTKETVAVPGGGPNGAAIGPDGAVYICNDGGFSFAQIKNTAAQTISIAIGQPPNYQGGSIQRVGLPDGKITTLYTHFNAKDPAGNSVSLPLRSPDDLVFDKSGGFWFTDWGKDRWRDRDITGVYYAQPDGSSIREVLFPLKSPNGIALSPDEKRLYVAESFTRRIRYWELDGAGSVDFRKSPCLDGSFLLTAKLPYEACPDSMGMDDQGNLYIACFLPHGANPNTNGGIAVVSPDGGILDWMEIDVEGGDPLPSNICFGGADLRTAFITLDGTGRLIACEMKIPGKRPAFGWTE
jgi:gluconolactonase